MSVPGPYKRKMWTFYYSEAKILSSDKLLNTFKVCMFKWPKLGQFYCQDNKMSITGPINYFYAYFTVNLYLDVPYYLIINF